MPPRRSARVVQTKKVVIETVEVSVIKEKKRRRQGIADDSEEEEEEAPLLKTIAIEDKETPISKTITIEDKEEEEEEEEEAPPLKTIAIEDKETPISKTITIEDKEEEEKQATHQVPIEPSEETEPSSSVEPETETPAAKEVIKGTTIDTPESEHRTASPEPQTKEGEEHNEAQKTAELEGIVAAAVVGNESRRKKRKGRKQRGRRNEATTREYKVYVYRVLKQVHPELSISSKAMTVINNFITDMCEKISEEAAKLSDYSHLKTMSSREIQGAVKLVLPGELGKHAVAEGTKAVTNYMSHYKEQSKA